MPELSGNGTARCRDRRKALRGTGVNPNPKKNMNRQDAKAAMDKMALPVHRKTHPWGVQALRSYPQLAPSGLGVHGAMAVDIFGSR